MARERVSCLASASRCCRRWASVVLRSYATIKILPPARAFDAKVRTSAVARAAERYVRCPQAISPSRRGQQPPPIFSV